MRSSLSVLLLVLLLTASMLQGQQWTSMNGPIVVQNSKDIVVDNSGNTVYIAEGSRLLKSTNSGTFWGGSASALESPSAVTCKPSDANFVVAAATGYVKWSTDGGQNWSTQNTPTTTGLSTLTLNTSPIYDNGISNYRMFFGRDYETDIRCLWTSTDGGQTWSYLNAFTYHTDVNDVAPYPVHDDGTYQRDDDVWACGSLPSSGSDLVRGLWTSPDAGATWSAVSNSSGNNLISVAVMHKASGTNQVLFVVRKDNSDYSVLRSTDLGGSWTTSLPSVSGRTIRKIRINSNSTPNCVLAASSQGIYRSTNDGADWEQVNNGLGSDIDVTSMAVGTGTTVYAGTASTMHKTTDNGSNWTNIGYMRVSSVAATYTTGNIWATSSDNAFAGFYSNSTWSTASMDEFSHAVNIADVSWNGNSGRFIACGSYDNFPAFYKTNSDGISWARKTVFDHSSGNKILGILQSPQSASVIWAFGRAYTTEWKSLFVSTDAGENWTAQGARPGGAGTWVYDLEGTMVSGNLWLFAASSNNKIYRDQNGGTGFTEEVCNVGAQINGLALNHDLSPFSTIYAGAANGVWKSTDQGGNWTQIRSSDDVKRIIMDPAYPNDANHLFIIGNGGNTVYYTANGGTSWSTIQGNISTPINDIKGDGRGVVYAATDKGVYSIDLAPATPSGIAIMTYEGHPKVTWTAYPEADLQKYEIWRYYKWCSWVAKGAGGSWDCSGYAYDEHAIDDVSPSTGEYIDEDFTVLNQDCNHALLMRRNYYYVKAIDLGNHASGNTSTVERSVDCEGANPEKIAIGELPKEQLPTSFSLANNFPNPFNPATDIKYALPEDSHVSLKVYDMLGREVAVLANEMQSAGYKSVRFDGTNLPSGIYLCRIMAGKFMDMKKMMLAK